MPKVKTGSWRRRGSNPRPQYHTWIWGNAHAESGALTTALSCPHQKRHTFVIFDHFQTILFPDFRQIPPIQEGNVPWAPGHPCRQPGVLPSVTQPLSNRKDRHVSFRSFSNVFRPKLKIKSIGRICALGACASLQAAWGAALHNAAPVKQKIVI